MGTGVLICGLNGAGKSTLGRALAEQLGFYFIDSEALYFPRTDPRYPYAFSRTREDVEKLLFQKIRTHGQFVFASVKGDYGSAFYPLLRYAVLMEVPRDIRITRVKRRSYAKFGNRMLPGGDLYEREEQFFSLVRSRPEGMVEEWIPALDCPVIRVDGTRPIMENIAHILQQTENSQAL